MASHVAIMYAFYVYAQAFGALLIYGYTIVERNIKTIQSLRHITA